MAPFEIRSAEVRFSQFARQPPGGYATAVAAPPPPLTKGDFFHTFRSRGSNGAKFDTAASVSLMWDRSETQPFTAARQRARIRVLRFHVSVLLYVSKSID